MSGRRIGWVLGWISWAGALLACAPLQFVPLEVDPRHAQIYIDGRGVPPGVGVVELRADRDHAVLIKAEGFQSELLLLRTGQSSGAAHLQPGVVRLRLLPLTPTGEEVRIEAEQP